MGIMTQFSVNKKRIKINSNIIKTNLILVNEKTFNEYITQNYNKIICKISE